MGKTIIRRKRISRKKKVTTRRRYKAGGKTSSKSHEYNDQEQEQEDGPIILQDHQISAVYRLFTGNNHGALVWHMMGTGKTITGLVAILNYPGKIINIICPHALIFVWENELNQIPRIKNKIHFYSYENYKVILKKSWDDEIIILDEAHHLVTIMRDSPDNASIINTKFNHAFRVLALTGTPIYRDLIDLIYLVNICAGQEVIPYNQSEFRKKYTNIKIPKSIVFGYIYPLVKIFGLLQIIKIIQVLPYVVKIGLQTPVYKQQFKMAATFMPVPSTIEDKPSLKKIKEIMNGKKNENEIYNMLIHIDTTKIDYTFIADEMLPQLTDIGISLNDDFNNITILSMSFAILYILSFVINIETLDDYSNINTKKIADDIEKYTSYHAIPQTSTSGFPNVKHHSIEVSYSMYQMVIWMEITRGCLPENVVELLSLEDPVNAKYYSKKLNMDTYLDHGIYIGNLQDQKTKEFSPKFHEIYKIAKGKRAVFYSNSVASGIVYFQDFLNSKNEIYLYFDINLTLQEKTVMLETFKQATSQCFLLIHPSYTEGVSILGAEQMHILEPIRLYSRKEQVIARVIRFQSHIHLEEQYRFVEIYQWSANMVDFIAMAKKFFVGVTTWYKHNPQNLIGFEEKVFSRSHTPDAIIMRNNEEMKKNDSQITKLLTQTTERKCCIAFPNNKQRNECLEATNNTQC